MIRLTIEAPGRREAYEGADAREVGEQIIFKYGPSQVQVPWEDRMDNGWVFPRFVITEELQSWAAVVTGTTLDAVRIEDL
ncbi:MAG: hypothetical protein LBJ02_01950 [Bifidobacteriaceae bacterium]|jgi:hypothetical protein|nr:hypothetical protein [Bifidobacteriaceae bacterium]